MAPRLTHRLGEEAVEGLLGAAAPPLLATRRGGLVDAARIAELSEILSEICRPPAVPAILLKGAALLASGWTAAGSRRLTDLDVLVPAAAAPTIARGFEARGFSSAVREEGRHHLPALAHPQLGTVELHVVVPGVLVEGGLAATEGLVAAGLCRAVAAPTSAAASFLEVPVPVFLRAHAAVHALAQHGLSPTVYPLLRMIADLIDLEPNREATPRNGEPETVTVTALSSRELAAVEQLARDLATGGLPVEGSDASALLRHAVAGATDRAYHRSLGRAAACRALVSGNWGKLARGLAERQRPAPGGAATALPLKTSRRASTPAIVWATLRAQSNR
jgi:hypothetical protein